MAKRKQKKKRKGAAEGERAEAQRRPEPQPKREHKFSPPATVSVELAKKPLAVAQAISAVLLLVGLVMLVLGGGVLTGRITEGWGFPMSAVPNWGRPWGAVLMIAGGAYIACPILILLRPRKGTIAMMIVSGLSVLVGTPLITTTTEIFYNLLAKTDCQADWTTCHPYWIDSVWGYFMVVNVANLIAIYRTHGSGRQPSAAPAEF